MPPRSAPPAVRTRGLVKSFGQTQALSGLDLDVERGEVLCLLGPNGAGKTTVVRILSTLLKADGGLAEVDSIDVSRRPDLVRRRIGLTGQYAAVDPALTGRENVSLVGRLYHLPRSQRVSQTRDLLDALDLSSVADRPVRTYSGGMRRRLDLAASLVGRPSVVFLDEPTTGLDPRGRRSIWELLRSLVADGTTLLLTTQYLEEADSMADRILLMERGAAVAEGTPEQLKQLVGGDVLQLTFGGEPEATRAHTVLGDSRFAPLAAQDGSPVVVVPMGEDSVSSQWQLAQCLEQRGLRPQGVTVRRVSLDDVFLALTGQSSGVVHE